jgi:cell division initiation protein
MRITPRDIEQKQFPMKLRGFDVEEVFAFLEVVKEEMQTLLRENESLKERLKLFENQSKEHNIIEDLRREISSIQEKVQKLENQTKEHKY